MKHSIKSLLATLVVSLCLAAPVLAGPYEDGRAAWMRKDYVTALRLMRPLAEQGNAGAQFTLGGMYLLGNGVPPDYVMGYMWLNLAAAQGVNSAIKLRDKLAYKLTPAQIAEAQRLALEWKPKKEARDNMLVVVLETADGKKSIHKEMVEGQACKFLLTSFAKAQRESTPLTLTFNDPEITGRVLDVHCVRPNGEIIRP